MGNHWSIAGAAPLPLTQGCTRVIRRISVFETRDRRPRSYGCGGKTAVVSSLDFYRVGGSGPMVGHRRVRTGIPPRDLPNARVVCGARLAPPSSPITGRVSSEEELSVLPRHTKVVVTGNNRTKSVLVGLHGVVKKAVGLGGWHWLVKLHSIP
ncbi:hypothetical protein BHM03_00051504 [Ensete ventricosum]|nr:hypothetical protein BHM03_00051504 [Ensete ventricosum]